MNMLRQTRERKGLTASQLASRAGVPTRLITEYEEGTQALPLAHAKLLAKALWVGIEDLLPPAGSVVPGSKSAPPKPPAARPAAPQPAAQSPAQADEAQLQPAASSRISPAGAEQREGQTKAVRGPRSSSLPAGSLSEGQRGELARLAVRLNIDVQQLDEKLGKSVGALTRPEAKEWIKRLRAMADQVAPVERTRSSQWPDMQEDHEANYLKQQIGGAPFQFKLFNGDQFTGTIMDYTPYTITIQPADSSGEVVLRKLAIAYYRSTHEAVASTGDAAHDHAVDDQHQPVGEAVGSDHAGEPERPEEDNMDDDRGV